MTAKTGALGVSALPVAVVEGRCAEEAASSQELRISALASYVGITYLWSWGCWAVLTLWRFEPFSSAWSVAYVLGLSGPSLAAVCMRWIEAGPEGLRSLMLPLTRWRIDPKAYLAAFGLPPAIAVLAAIGSWPLFRANAKVVALSGIAVLFVKMLVRGGPLNEEMGWRGYLLPALLTRLSPFAASLVMWPIWGLWHIPLWIIPGVQHQAWPLGLFMVMMLPISFAFTAVYRLGNGSLLPAILLHAVINVTMYFTPMLAIYGLDMRGFFLRLNAVWFIAMAGLIIKQRDWFSPPRQKSRA